MPALARNICWRQAEIFLAFRSFNEATAKLALQPLINLGRLLIRDGDSTAAYRLLDALFEAVRSEADTVIADRSTAGISALLASPAMLTITMRSCDGYGQSCSPMALGRLPGQAAHRR